MPEFTPSRSRAIRDGLIQHASARTQSHAIKPFSAGHAVTATNARAGDTPGRRDVGHRGFQWAAAAVAVILVGGVVAIAATAGLNGGGTVAGPSLPSPSTSISSPPASTPTGAPSSPPPVSPPAQDPTDPTTWVVSQSGMGPLTIGMPFTAAIAAVPGAQAACENAYFVSPDNLFFARWGEGADDPLDVVTWARAEGPRTAEGIGIGSSPDDVRAAYPDVTEVQRQGAYLQSGAVFFRIETGVVDEIGVTSSDIPWEYCG